MLKKLRIKLTMISMLLVTLVLALALVSLLVTTYRRSVTETENALEMALSRSFSGPREDLPVETASEDEEPPVTPDQSDQRDGRYFDGSVEIGRPRGGAFDDGALIPTVVVRVAADGTYETIRTNMATISEDTLTTIVADVVGLESDAGRLSDYDLRYRRQPAGEDTFLLALADASRELSELRSQALSSLLIGIPALILLFFVSLGLSSLALKPVQRSMEQQKQFVADASHELKTPLTVIMANNDILMRHQDADVASQMKWLESTHDEGTRMRELIDDLLFLAKSDADRLPVTLSEISFSDLVEETILTFEPVAFEQGILLESTLAPELRLTADSTQMKQLIMILLDNAVKYSEPSGTVKIRLYQEASAACLTVNNHGEVIAPEALPHLFERFYRTDEARSRQEKGGYGLGLSIAQTIVTLHKGKISCTSSEAEGTTFLVQLPMDRRSARKNSQ